MKAVDIKRNEMRISIVILKLIKNKWSLPVGFGTGKELDTHNKMALLQT